MEIEGFKIKSPDEIKNLPIDERKSYISALEAKIRSAKNSGVHLNRAERRKYQKENRKKKVAL